ncbi:MAG: ComEA family DNA-binding protein [Planctomycetota bacterium]
MAALIGGALRYIMDRDRQNSIQSFAFVISTCMAVSFCRGFASSHTADESTLGQHVIELENRINPNIAPVESLVRLPALGISRAGAIVAYRKSFSRANGARAAFECGDDLQKIRGVGPKTVQQMSNWIKFE